MPFSIVCQDITTMQVDAIVNAANTALRMGGGVCGAIFRAAGAKQLQAACDRLAPIRTGEAVLTPGFALPAKYVIHAAGPIYREEERELCGRQLRAAYNNALRLAVEHGCGSIAFPLISSGIYGYPKEEALRVAVSSIREFLSEHDIDVFLAVLDRSAIPVRKELRDEIQRCIDAQEPRQGFQKTLREALSRTDSPAKSGLHLEDALMAPMCAPALPDDVAAKLDEPFSRALLRLIDEKGMTDVEVYKRANLDRRLFSKIRSIKGYLPGKRTAVALAVALRLSLDETDDLLRCAGYALSSAVLFDAIVGFFIAGGRYDIDEINEVLFACGQPLLGG